ncbi:MAG TPA: class I SAM-dependent methyltransferase [Verrucomicrobiae bacterium]|nr:class I SAM-dependent methyltransferase [Verrucomicrobiae bacterium]
MDLASIRNAYRRYAPSYDAIFGPALEPGRRNVMEKMNCRPGELVLEVGVGTGLSLPRYDRKVRVVGIDLSPEMLERARALRERERLENVIDLLEMDAEHMSFADDTFDKVVAMYVASVVPDPVRLVEEMRRVCKPGGDIFIINHFRSTNPVVSSLEKMISPLSRLLGWKPDFSLDEFLQQTGLEVAEKCGANYFGYWTMIRSVNHKEQQELPRVAYA